MDFCSCRVWGQQVATKCGIARGRRSATGLAMPYPAVSSGHRRHLVALVHARAGAGRAIAIAIRRPLASHTRAVVGARTRFLGRVCSVTRTGRYSHRIVTRGRPGRLRLPVQPRTHMRTYRATSCLITCRATGSTVWRLARPLRPGCPGVLHPPVAEGQLAIAGHRLAVLPSSRADAFTLTDYNPMRGDFRVGECDRSAMALSHHLSCSTIANGTWGADSDALSAKQLQLLWIGDHTVMRFISASGRYSLWRVDLKPPTSDQHAFGHTLIANGVLLTANGEALRDATLTYLDRGVVLAMSPRGATSLYRRTPIEGKGFVHEWGMHSVLHGWQLNYVGDGVLIAVEPSSSAYRLVNCSVLYSERRPAIASTSGRDGRAALPAALSGNISRWRTV